MCKSSEQRMKSMMDTLAIMEEQEEWAPLFAALYEAPLDYPEFDQLLKQLEQDDQPHYEIIPILLLIVKFTDFGEASSEKLQLYFKQMSMGVKADLKEAIREMRVHASHWVNRERNINEIR